MTSDQQLQLTVVAVGIAVEITNLSQCPFTFTAFGYNASGRDIYWGFLRLAIGISI
jgi:hypothetical protein